MTGSVVDALQSENRRLRNEVVLLEAFIQSESRRALLSQGPRPAGWESPRAIMDSAHAESPGGEREQGEQPSQKHARVTDSAKSMASLPGMVEPDDAAAGPPCGEPPEGQRRRSKPALGESTPTTATDAKLEPHEGWESRHSRSFREERPQFLTDDSHDSPGRTLGPPREMSSDIYRGSSQKSLKRHGGTVWDAADLKFDLREKRRLRRIFDLNNEDTVVSFDRFIEVVAARRNTPTSTRHSKRITVTDYEWTEEVLRRVQEALEVMSVGMLENLPPIRIPAGVTVEGLTMLVGRRSQDVLDSVDLDAQAQVAELVDALNVTTAAEIVQEAAQMNIQPVAEERPLIAERRRFLIALNVIVGITVLVNVVSLGLSIDYSPDGWGWLLLDGLSCAIFVFEVAVKWKFSGYRDYFIGPARWWNWMDFSMTVIALGDLALSLSQLMHDSKADGTRVANAARGAMLLRALRLARVIRLIKLVHTPLLRDFANMIVGFVIGMPALWWVLVIIASVVYLLGLGFRLTLGPVPGQDLVNGAGCGFGDEWTNFDDPLCKVHLLYGEEFFGSVANSMFTAFRFMLGDYSTRAGKSLIVAFSAGYGRRFDTAFVVFMVITVFGMFNIITAIFVESTISGLKHNDTKRKYARQYERAFVKNKLEELIAKVQDLHNAKCFSYANRPDAPGGLALNEESFRYIMDNAQVRDIMEDLDISTSNPAGMFDTFDPDGDGEVTLTEFVQAIMKLRGDPQKNDIISCFVAVRALQDKFDSLSLFLKARLGEGPRSKSGTLV